jgi:hypothetical protein
LVEEPLVVVSVPVVLLPVDEPLPIVLPLESMLDVPLRVVVSVPVVLRPDVVSEPVVVLPVVPEGLLLVELPAAPVVLLPLEPVALEPVLVEPLPIVLLPDVPLLFIGPVVPEVPPAGPGVRGVVALGPPPLPAAPPELPPDEPPPACANARPAAIVRAAETATIACLFMRKLLCVGWGVTRCSSASHPGNACT